MQKATQVKDTDQLKVDTRDHKAIFKWQSREIEIALTFRSLE